MPTDPTITNVDDNFTMSFSGAITVTNFDLSSAGTLNYIRLFTTSTGSLTVFSAGLRSQYGLHVNTNDTLVLYGNSTLSYGNNSFEIIGGTLVVSNSANVVVNIGALAVQNQGTIQFTATNTQISTFNYGLSNGGSMNNSGTGTIIKNGAGEGLLESNFGASTNGLANNGTIIVNAGSLEVDMQSATGGGFQNNSSGTITVNSGASFVIERLNWANGGDTLNQGTIILNGGNLTAMNNNSTYTSNAGGSFQNQKTILGNGTISAPFFATAAASQIVSNGTLTFAGWVYDNSSTWVATNIGGVASVLQFINNTATLASGTLLNSNGTVQVGSGFVVLPNSFRNNAGTLSLNSGSFQPGNVGGLVAFTNAGTGVIVGSGTIQNFVPTVASYNFINKGTIVANVNAQKLTIRPEDGNFSNSASGVIIVTNGATFSIARTSGAIGTDARNEGTVILNNGSIEAYNSSTSSQDSTKTLQQGGNAQIVGNGTLSIAIFNNMSGGTEKVIASNGLLSVGTVYGTGAGTWVATNYVGAAASVLEFRTGNDMASGTFLNSNGTIRVSGASISLPTSFVRNDGTLQLAGGSITYGAGTVLTNAGTGIIYGTGTIAGNVSALSNLVGGTVMASNGTLNILSGAVAQRGTMRGGFGGGAGGSTLVITNTTNMLINNGTMIVEGTANNGDAASYLILRATSGAGVEFTNAVSGVITGQGFFATGDFQTGGRNFTIRNQGNIIANGGTLILQPADVQIGGGFINDVGATATVASASTLGIQRTSGAWNSGTLPSNLGVIQMNGGSLVFYTDNVVVDNTRVLSNAAGGTITGFGTLNVSLANVGTIVATNGALIVNNGGLLLNTGTIQVRGGTGANAGTLTILGTGAFTNASGAQILITSGTGGGFLIATNLAQFVNAGTISGAGTFQTGRASGSGGNNASIINAGGTIVATNGTLRIQPGDAFTAGGFSNAAGSVVRIVNGGTLLLNRTSSAWNNDSAATNLANLGTIDMQGGNFQLANSGAVAGSGNGVSKYINNSGTISGWGTITASISNKANLGWIIASNGVLVLEQSSPFFQGNYLQVVSNSTLQITNTVNSVLMDINNSGTILMNGGTLVSGSITNTGTITGWGTVTGGITNAGGSVLADARLNANRNRGTLTVSLISFTNNNGATIGAIGTNSTLLVAIANSALINNGTIQLSAGNIVLSNTVTGTTGGSITNFNTIAGVGDVSSFPIVQSGSSSSLIAKDPTDGSNNLVATVGSINSAVLGAVSNANGIATLQLSLSGGANVLSNAGTIAMQGGAMTVNGTSGVISNSGIIYGFGSLSNNVANLTAGSITASNGTFRVGLLNNRNAGLLSNFNSGATVLLTNTILQNTGTIALNGGGFRMAGSVVTNQGSITGPGDFAPALYNDTTGVVLATNGQLNVSTNTPLAGENIQNFGTFSIANGSTLNVVPAWLNTNGTVAIGNAGGGGNLIGGTVTNQGLIVGNGLITNATAVVNLSGGTIKASNGVLRIESSVFTTNSGTLIGGTAGGSYLQITNLSTPFLNNGTMVLDSPAGGNTNLAFYILHDFTNTSSAVIRGAGILRTGDGVVGGGGRNSSVVNLGTIQATNGTLIVDTGDAFFSAFKNNVGATVNVAAASTFGISATTNAWLNTTLPVNNGVIILSGGTIRSFTNVNTGTAATPVAIASSSAIYGIISNSTTGVISGFGTIGNNLINNLGTINATNGTLVIAGTAPLTNNVVGVISIQNGATLTSLQSSGSLQNNGTILMNGGTLVATSMTAFVIGQTGSITGYGTINTGTKSGSGGDNARIVNSGGTIVATNGTLFVNPGDAFSQGGFSNSLAGRITVASGAAFVLNRTSHAWNNDSTATNVANLGAITLAGGSWSNYSEGVADSSRFVKNVGTIIGNGIFYGSLTNVGTIIASNGVLTVDGSSRFGQSGTLTILAGGTLSLTNSTASSAISFTNGGSILMRGGELQAGVIANTNVIFGFGIISGGGVDNSGALLASNGVLTAGLSSFTNGTTATLGTLTTNATLDVTIPGGVGQPLINRGTLSFAGGTLLANGSASGTISNRSTGTILGVGNVTQTVVNDGTVMAANPVSGLNIFSVGLGEINGTTATLGASNGAILNVVISGGAGSSFNNNGSISMIGGTLIISNATPGIITNMANAFVTGVGTVMPNIVNLNNGTIQATVSGGILDISLSTTNSGYLGAGSVATLTIESTSFVNAGTIGAVGTVGGAIQMAAPSGVITNRALITGSGGLAINGYVQNDPVGRITATNGVLAFNSINGLRNEGTIDVQNGGTFQSNSSNSWANAGTIDMRGGTLRTGGYTNAAVSAVFTNNGQIGGFGTIVGGGAYGLTGAGIDKSIVNLGTIIATNPLSSVAQTLYISTGGATSGNGIQNLGNMIVSSNNTLALDRGGLPILNTGTITINNGTLSTTSTLTNTLGGIIQGYGTLTASIVNQSGGTIRATNGVMVMTASVSPVNFGTFEVDGGATLTWNATNSWQNNGTVDLRGGTLRTGGPTNALAGGEPFTNLNYIVGFGTVIGGGAFNTNGSGFDKAIMNLGTVVASGGTLTLNTGVATANRGLANLGTMIIATTNDTLQLLRTAEIQPTFTNLNYIYNSGTILINGGTLTSNTSITNQFESASLPGLIQGFGTVALTNELVNLGTIRSTNTVVGGDGILRFVNPASSALQIRQSGTLVVEGASQMIFGSDSNAPVANAGTIIMNGGILRSGTLTNQFDATFRGFGTITSSIINSGTGLATSASLPLHLMGSMLFNQTNGVLGANNGRLIVDSVFTNAGTVSFINSMGTFASAVVNQGAWIMDPSTNVFLSDYTVASNGFITMTSGDVSIFKSNFVNQSRNSNSFNTVNGKFIFDGDGGSTQVFTVAGLNLGGYASSQQASNETFFTTINGTFSTNSFLFGGADPIFGFSNNFALGTLQIGSLNTTSTLMLVDAFLPGSSTYSNDNFVAGLYVQDLTLSAGSLLIISNNVQLYFVRSNGVTGISFGTLNPGDNVLILDGGSFHQLAVIPEPSILMLLTLGGIAIVRHRRRSAARGRQK